MAGWLHRLIYGNGTSPTDAENAQRESLGRQKQLAGDATSGFLRDRAAFDPDAAFRTSAQGAYGDFSRELSKTLRSNRDAEVDAGRFDSGLYSADRGDIMKDLGGQYVNNLNSRALDVAGMRQRGLEDEQSYSQFQQQDYNDLVTGALDRETADRNSRRQYKASLISGFLQMGGKIGGAAAGGGGGG
jgi:hypothetical protein